jgi:hypothetical protein
VEQFTLVEASLTESCDPGWLRVAMKTPLWKARLSLDGVLVYLDKSCKNYWNETGECSSTKSVDEMANWIVTTNG